MSDLLTNLTVKPQRETAGADAAARFDYQKDWAFCRMMRRHIDDESYLIAFEFHDDVLILSPADIPTNADFYQVKTSSAARPRSLASITSRPKNKASIAGKIFSNFEGICSTHDVRVTLVSNNAFEFADDEACAEDLDEKFRKRLLEKLTAEIPGFDENRLKNLHFLVTGVSLEAMQSFLEGEAMDLFCHKFGEDHGLNIRTWIRLIKGEIARKNNYSSSKITNVEELVKRKCIDRPFVDETLDVIHGKATKPLDVSTISHYLATNGWTAVDVIRFQKNIPEASKDFYNPLNVDVKYIIEQLKSYIYGASDQVLDLIEFLDLSVDLISKDKDVANVYKNVDYLRALGTLVYHDAI